MVFLATEGYLDSSETVASEPAVFTSPGNVLEMQTLGTYTVRDYGWETAGGVQEYILTSPPVTLQHALIWDIDGLEFYRAISSFSKEKKEHMAYPYC